MTWLTPNQRQEVCCAFWKATHSYRQAGLSRNDPHSSTESEIISDAGLRLEGISALNLWEKEIVVLVHPAGRSPMRNTKPKNTKYLMADNRVTDGTDYVPPNAHICSQWASWFVFDDNDSVIKMIIKGQRPSTRHISQTHRVNLDRLFDWINPDPGSKLKTSTPPNK